MMMMIVTTTTVTEKLSKSNNKNSHDDVDHDSNNSSNNKSHEQCLHLWANLTCNSWCADSGILLTFLWLCNEHVLYWYLDRLKLDCP